MSVSQISGFITDVHHFYLLGVDQYKRFQRLAAEKFVNLQNERQYCPYANCGAAFMLEQIDDENMVSCPECARLYCCICRSADGCRCRDDVKNLQLCEVIKPSLIKPNLVA